MIYDYFVLAFDGIRKRKIRSWLTMLGIFIGIASVVSLISLGEGMKQAVTSQFASFGTDKLTIQAGGLAGFGPPGTLVVNKLSEDNIEAIENVNGVKLVVSRLIRTAKLEVEDEQIFEMATNLPEEPKARRLVLEVLNLNIEQGRHLKPIDRHKVVLGNAFAHRNKFSENLKVRDNILIEGTQFEIVGILKVSGNPIFNGIVIMNDDIYRDVLDVGKEVDLIAVQVNNPAEMVLIEERIQKVMRKERDVEEGKEDFTIQTPAQVLESVGGILTSIQVILVGIAAISLVVGGIGIMNTMYTSVVERTREIGIMKAVGARNRDVLLLFLVESGILGMLGGIIGILLGIALSKSVEIIALKTLGTALLQARFTSTLIVGSLLFSFLAGTISGVLPAIQASKLNPVDALRK